MRSISSIVLCFLCLTSYSIRSVDAVENGNPIPRSREKVREKLNVSTSKTILFKPRSREKVRKKSIVFTSKTILFKPWDYGLPCWRIPATVKVYDIDRNLTRILVFAEGRYPNGDGCSVPGGEDIGRSSRSTTTTIDDRRVPGGEDIGLSGRSSSTTIDDLCKGYYRNIFYRYSDNDGQEWSDIYKLAGTNVSCLTDPAPVFYRDRVTGESKVIVQYSARGGTETWQHVSLDYGLTFDAKGTLLNDQLGVAAAGKRPGPAGGFFDPFTGRLMISGYAGKFDAGVSVWYSDDGGNRWDVANVSGKGPYDTNTSFENVTESVLVRLPLSGNVLLSMRVDAASPRRAALAIVDKTFSPPFAYSRSPPFFNESAAPSGASLPSTSTGDMGSLLSTDDAVYYSMALAPDQSRSRMTVLMSLDDAESWTHGIVVYDGPSAYSDLTTLADARSLGLAYERDAEDHSTCEGVSCTIVFESIAKTLPPFTPPHR